MSDLFRIFHPERRATVLRCPCLQSRLLPYMHRHAPCRQHDTKRPTKLCRLHTFCTARAYSAYLQAACRVKACLTPAAAESCCSAAQIATDCRPKAYTVWNMKRGARVTNYGSRIDFILAADGAAPAGSGRQASHRLSSKLAAAASAFIKASCSRHRMQPESNTHPDHSWHLACGRIHSCLESERHHVSPHDLQIAGRNLLLPMLQKDG